LILFKQALRRLGCSGLLEYLHGLDKKLVRCDMVIGKAAHNSIPAISTPYPTGDLIATIPDKAKRQSTDQQPMTTSSQVFSSLIFLFRHDYIVLWGYSPL
jgi:hypothetical protein